MKIAVDAGALCSNSQFGTYTFSFNFIKALKKYNKTNSYCYYSFCKGLIDSKKLPSKLFSFWGMFEDVVLALNQQPPIYTRGKIISFCHGLSYNFFPQYYSNKDIFRLRKQLTEMIKRSDVIVVSSQRVKDELVSMNQFIDTKVIVIPFGIPFDMENKSKVVRSIKPKAGQEYFLYVGMDHPIKNINFIKNAFKEFKKDSLYKNYDLKILTRNVQRNKLKELYQNATGLLTASHYESFNFPVLEALVNDCPVIGLKPAIIHELAEYVAVCDNSIGDYVEKMKNLVNEKKVINKKTLSKIFSWKKYVEHLKKCY